MHWFWRAAICFLSVFAGLVVAAVILPKLTSTLGYEATLIVVATTSSISVLVYGTLTNRLTYRPSCPETRCRKCGYILRGISEPRCPECGERI